MGGEECETDTWDAASITCTLPALPPGVYPVAIYTGSDGFARSGILQSQKLDKVRAVCPSIF